MLDTSRRGVEVLRVLALSIRSDQDYGLTKNDPTTVGALKVKATPGEVKILIKGYQPPYSSQPGFRQLNLRQALNKIAHADPTGSGFFADNDTHDLMLSGTDKGVTWIAVISLIDLCDVIRSLPDAETR